MVRLSIQLHNGLCAGSRLKSTFRRSYSKTLSYAVRGRNGEAYILFWVVDEN